jgi:xanthine/uracil/vitamin C permease (AzgA family)
MSKNILNMPIGALMMSQAIEINWHNMVEAIPAFLTLFLIPFTFSITHGIMFGLLAAFILYITTGQFLVDLTDFYNHKDRKENTVATTGFEETGHLNSGNVYYQLSEDSSFGATTQ